MTYVKEDAYLALKREVEELKGFKSKVEALEATVAQRALHGSSEVATKRATTPILGDRARDVTLVYRLRKGGKPTSPLPPDFLSDEHWNFVDVIGPKNDPGIDLSGHIGEIRATVPPAGSDEDTIKNWAQHIPVNWVICDGRTVKRPDESSYTAPNYLDHFLLHFPPGASSPALGSKNGSWNYIFSGKSGDQDHDHTHGVGVHGATGGATLSVGQLAHHQHRVGIDDHQGAGGCCGNPDANPGTYWHLWTNYVGSNQPHSHNIAFTVTSAEISHGHAHEVTLSSVGNRPPHICVWYIQRFFKEKNHDLRKR